MAISQDLLGILVCPVCKAPIELLQDENGLRCQPCRMVFPIRDDIPVMLVEEARKF
ncbi:MAG: Trm112 family protein [Acidobacteria bacterium]|nr:Trm112 family protein [Acidobacteriota bacterium]